VAPLRGIPYAGLIPAMSLARAGAGSASLQGNALAVNPAYAEPDGKSRQNQQWKSCFSRESGQYFQKR